LGFWGRAYHFRGEYNLRVMMAFGGGIANDEEFIDIFRG